MNQTGELHPLERVTDNRLQGLRETAAEHGYLIEVYGSNDAPKYAIRSKPILCEDLQQVGLMIEMMGSNSYERRQCVEQLESLTIPILKDAEQFGCVADVELSLHYIKSGQLFHGE